jgi:prepilin-type N-terminal cleavage/methylation domain-containing protein
MKMGKSKFNLGFTLLEIMIAMTIFAVVLVAVYSSWAVIVRGSKVGLEAAAAAQRSRIAMRTIEDALLTAQLYTENLQHYSFIADTTDSKFAWLNFTAHLPSTFPGSGLFGDDVVRRVTFAVEPDTDGTKQLVMYQTPFLLVTNSDITAYPITLVRDLSLFVIEFWDTQLGDWTDELLVTNQIPKMMRVSLGIGYAAHSGSQPDQLVSRIIAMPSIAVTPDIQIPSRQGGGTSGGGGSRPGGGGTSGGGTRPGGTGSQVRPL